MMRLQRGTFLVCLVLGAFLIRLAVLLLLQDLTSGPEGPPSGDNVEFNHLAWQVAQGHGFVTEEGKPTSFRAPGFPFYLALLYLLAGQCYPLAYLSFCVLGALTCLLTYLLACELLDESLSRLAAVLAAVYPPHVHLVVEYISENAFVPLLALGLWLFLRHLKTQSLGLLALAGLSLGAATLVRPFGLLLLPLLLLVLARVGLLQRRWPVLPGLVFGATFVVLILPWTVRNYRVHGKPVLLATNGGSTFYGGNNHRVVSELRQYGHWISTTKLPDRDKIDATPNELEHDQMEWHLGWQWLKNNPAAWPRLVVFKVGRLIFWLPDLDPADKWLRALAYLPFLALFLCGLLVCTWRRDYWTPAWVVVHVTLLATLLTAIIFWGSPRFRDANSPVLVLYGAVGAQVLFRRWLQTPQKTEAVESHEQVTVCEAV